MKGILNYESKIMQFGNRAVDLLVLNLLTIALCIPVLTIGASLTSMHYVLIKLQEDGDAAVVKCFFSAFRKNFKQATIIWIVCIVFAIIIAADLHLISNSYIESNAVTKGILAVLIAVLLIITLWSFILLSRYDNTVRNMIKNSFAVGLLNLGSTIIMIAIAVVPVVLLVLLPKFFPTILAFGLSLPGYFQMKFYKKVFKKFEQSNLENPAE